METSTDYIEDYINNKLSAEDRARFDELLIADSTFANEVKEHFMLLNSFDEKQAEELLIEFDKIERQIEGRGAKKLGYPVYLRWAAAIIVLAVLSVVVYQKTKVTNADLFLAYYSAYPNVENPVSRSGSDGDQVWQVYENGNYAKAYVEFENIVVKDKANLTNLFYLGISALEINKITEAITAFAKVSNAGKGNYVDQAAWYLGLSYLKSGEIRAAKEVFGKIKSSDSDYANRAAELLLELE